MKNLKFKIFLALVATLLLLFTILNVNHQSKIDDTYNLIILKTDLVNDKFFLIALKQNQKEDIINLNLFSNKSLLETNLIEEYTSLTEEQITFISDSTRISEETNELLGNLMELKNIHKYYNIPYLFFAFLNAFLGVFLIILESKKNE